MPQSMALTNCEQDQIIYGCDNDIFCHDLTHTDQRSLIFHLLYAAEAFEYDASLESIADNFSRGFGMTIPTNSEVFLEAQGIINQREILDEQIKPYLANWKLERLGVPTKLIMRIALWEKNNTTTDANVIINEAVELAKCFAERDSYKFINGVLDQVLKSGETAKTDL